MLKLQLLRLDQLQPQTIYLNTMWSGRYHFSVSDHGPLVWDTRHDEAVTDTYALRVYLENSTGPVFYELPEHKDTLLDRFANKVVEGDLVAVATNSYKQTNLRVGTVEKFNPETGKLTVRDLTTGSAVVANVRSSRVNNNLLKTGA